MPAEVAGAAGIVGKLLCARTNTLLLEPDTRSQRLACAVLAGLSVFFPLLRWVLNAHVYEVTSQATLAGRPVLPCNRV